MGEGSAITVVGGFTIKALVGPGFSGAVYTVEINGVKSTAFGIDGIIRAAGTVQSKAFSGVVEDVNAWIIDGGAIALEMQATANANNQQPAPPPTPTTQETQNAEATKAAEDAETQASGIAATPSSNMTDDDGGNPSTTSAPAGVQPTSVRTGDIGGKQKVNKPNTSASDSTLGTSDELPGRRVYNPLSNLSSYTYNITLYMVNPDALNLFVLSGGRIVKDSFDVNGTMAKGFYIIAQSGGINNNSENRAFTFGGEIGDKTGGYDYFIDDLTYETLTIANDGSNTPTNSVNFQFKITEPLGFNLLTDLTNASRQILGKSAKTKDSKVQIEPLQQHYMLGIRFYGYDVNGNLVTSQNFAESDSATANNTPFSLNASTDTNTLFERFYPIIITNSSFKLDGKAIVYTFNAQGTSLQTAFGEKRGLIKKPTEFFASTVEEALLGMMVNGDPSEPFWSDPAASSFANENGRERPGSDPRTAQAQSTNPTGNKQPRGNPKSGLLQILNSDLIDEELTGRRSKAPKYYVQFLPGDLSIRNAKIENKDAQSAGGSGANKTSASNAQASARASKAQTNGARISIAAGTPIVQAIDDIISNSSYIDDALIVVNSTDPETKPSNKKASNKLRWYSINPVVKITSLDDKINDWVYDVCYQIQPYDIPYIRSAYKGINMEYYGPHKRYEYWYTGNNKEIILYEQEFNALYYQLASSSVGTDNSAENNNPGDSVPLVTQGGSGSRVNGSKTNRAGAINQNVKASLYSTADQAQAKIKIIGDPDYLFQTVLGGPSFNQPYSKRYGQGLTINPNGGQIFIEIQFNNALDYNDSGLLEISDQVQFYKTNVLKNRGVKGIIYKVIQVTSTFSRGKFEQVLDLILVNESILTDREDLSDSERAELTAAGFAVSRSNDNSMLSSKNVPGKKENVKPAPRNLGGNNPDGNQSSAETNRLNAQNAIIRTVPTRTGIVVDDDGSGLGQISDIIAP